MPIDEKTPLEQKIYDLVYTPAKNSPGNAVKISILRGQLSATLLAKQWTLEFAAKDHQATADFDLILAAWPDPISEEEESDKTFSYADLQRTVSLTFSAK